MWQYRTISLSVLIFACIPDGHGDSVGGVNDGGGLAADYGGLGGGRGTDASKPEVYFIKYKQQKEITGPGISSGIASGLGSGFGVAGIGGAPSIFGDKHGDKLNTELRSKRNGARLLNAGRSGVGGLGASTGRFREGGTELYSKHNSGGITGAGGLGGGGRPIFHHMLPG